MTAPRKSADKIISELGIAEPEDIDIEAVAQYCNATVVYERLTGCEARIIGNADRAIITVNSESHRARQRFSVGHELGHWMLDRNKIGFACTNIAFRSQWGAANPERAANAFAADLLLPTQIFERYAHAVPITLQSAHSLAAKFQTSLTATAIRLVQHGSFPAMIIYFVSGARKWFVAGPDVPHELFPKQELHQHTLAWDLMKGNSSRLGPTDVQADAWIQHPRSKWYEVVEDSIRFADESILTMLWWKNEKQIIDLSDDE